MTHTLIARESHELPSHVRPFVHLLYAPDSTPNLFNLAPDCTLYTGWMGHKPVAAVSVDWSDFDTLHQIRLTDATCKKPIMLRGLIDQLLLQVQPRLRQRTTISLNIKCDETVKPDLFLGVGFQNPLRETVYELPMYPFQKETYNHWQLSLECPETYDSWLLKRNMRVHQLPGGLPLSSKFIDAFHKKQGLVYSLKRNGVVQCTMRARIEFLRLHILEFNMIGDLSLTQEAISFLQQLFYQKLNIKEGVTITTTSYQSELQDVLVSQEAIPMPGSTYTLLKSMTPHPSLV